MGLEETGHGPWESSLFFVSLTLLFTSLRQANTGWMLAQQRPAALNGSLLGKSAPRQCAHDICRNIRMHGIEPFQLFAPPQPRQLTFRQLSRCRNRLLLRSEEHTSELQSPCNL